jgi:hypothetical protein
MATPLFRLVCPATALEGAPDGWASDMLVDGEVALLIGDGDLSAVNTAAHALDHNTVSVVRTEDTPELQEKTVIAHARQLPLIWIDRSFSSETRNWAVARGPMTLIIENEGALPEVERGRITRFVALLGRQTD